MAKGDRVHLEDGTDRNGTVVADPDPENPGGVLVIADEDLVIVYDEGALISDYTVGVNRTDATIVTE